MPPIWWVPTEPNLGDRPRQDLRREEAQTASLRPDPRAGGHPERVVQYADRSKPTTSNLLMPNSDIDGCWWVAPRWSQPASPPIAKLQVAVER